MEKKSWQPNQRKIIRVSSSRYDEHSRSGSCFPSQSSAHQLEFGFGWDYRTMHSSCGNGIKIKIRKKKIKKSNNTHQAISVYLYVCCEAPFKKPRKRDSRKETQTTKWKTKTQKWHRCMVVKIIEWSSRGHKIWIIKSFFFQSADRCERIQWISVGRAHIHNAKYYITVNTKRTNERTDQRARISHNTSYPDRINGNEFDISTQFSHVKIQMNLQTTWTSKVCKSKNGAIVLVAFDRRKKTLPWIAQTAEKTATATKSIFIERASNRSTQ